MDLNEWEQGRGKSEGLMAQNEWGRTFSGIDEHVFSALATIGVQQHTKHSGSNQESQTGEEFQSETPLQLLVFSDQQIKIKRTLL